MPEDIQWFYPTALLLALMSLFSIFPYELSLVLWIFATLALAMATAYQYDLMLLSIPFTLLVYDFLIEGCKKTDIIMVCILWLMPLLTMPIVHLVGIQISHFILIGMFVYVCHRAKVNPLTHPSLTQITVNPK